MEGKFYELHTGNASQCYWADVIIEPGRGIFRNGMRDFGGVLHLNIIKGGKPCDFMGNNASLHIASARVLDLIRECGLTGYGTYDVEITGGTVELPGYRGLMAVGRGGHILPKESGLEYGPRRPDGTRAIMGMKRLVFDESQWDGSDFFYLDESLRGILVTERVRDVFRKHKVRNCELTPLDEVSF